MRHLEYMKKRLKEEEMKWMLTKSQKKILAEDEMKKKQANQQSDNIELSKLVNHPDHYTNSSIETIDMIESITAEGFHYYLEGNILKYLARYRHKNGIQDLQKALWYLNKLIEVQYDTSDGDVHT